MIETIKARFAALFSKAKGEPVLIMYGILFAVNAAAYFGFEVPVEWLAAVDSALVPALAYLTRKQVTPLSKLEPMTVNKFIELYGEGDEDSL